jgi:hypothetical protein
MPNPVRTARKAGRSLVKDTKQTIKADKITKRYEAKADKIGKKSRAAISAAKAKSEAKAGVTPSTVSKIEPLKKNLQIPPATPLKFELAKPSASAIAAKEAAFKPTPKAAAPKKSSGKSSGKSTTKTTGPTPYLTGKDLPPAEKSKSKSTTKSSNPKGLYDGVADPNKKISDYTLGEVGRGVKNTAISAAADAVTIPSKITKAVTDASVRQLKRSLNAVTLGIFEDKLKRRGGAMKSSYKKGGSVKRKK